MTRPYRRWCARGSSARAAWRAWTRGDIGEAERHAAHATGRQRGYLLFLTSFVRGCYERALDHYAALNARRLEFTELDQPVAHAWLHLGRPDEAYAHLRRRGKRRPPPALRSLVEHPMRSVIDHTVDLPFIDHALASCLPAVDASIDGHRLPVHIDTGAPFIVMGTRRAEALGIRLTGTGRARQGVAHADSHTGTARELALGDATLTNVPIVALSTLHADQDVVVVGTNVLRQFLATIDHPGQRLLLSPRRDQRRAADHHALLGPPSPAATVPFYLWGDHFMFARGGFGTRSDLNFFIDSGLVYVTDEDDAPPRQASLYGTARRYRSWGIPPARTAAPHFEADEPIRLGPLRQDRPLVATAAARHVPWESFGGIRIDAMLAPGFLNRYAWTLDFDRHEYTFREPAPGG